jgi:hypothetical protein
MAPRLHVAIGKQRFTESPRWPSENDYIASVQRQTKGLVKAIEEIVKQFKEASPEIMIEALRPTFELSQVYVPKDTGALMRSGYLEEAMFRGKPRVEIGYGYRNSPLYAQLVHERTDLYHEPPTKAKFLQDAVMEDLPNIYKRLGENYRRFMGS